MREGEKGTKERKGGEGRINWGTEDHMSVSLATVSLLVRWMKAVLTEHVQQMLMSHSDIQSEGKTLNHVSSNTQHVCRFHVLTCLNHKQLKLQPENTERDVK